MRLDLRLCALVAISFCAAPSHAQEKTPVSLAECDAQQAALAKDMRAARSRGQMLRRRQLEESLHALQQRCEEAASQETHEARVLRQKYVVMQRQLDLDQAQEQLRQLLKEKP